MSDVTYLVPAKGWSMRLSEKNLREIHNVPLFVYALQQIAASKFYDKERTWVITESQKVVEAVTRWGYGRILEPLEVMPEQNGVAAALRRAKRILTERGLVTNIVCVVYANCPARAPDTIDRCIAMLDKCLSVKTYDAHGVETGNVWASLWETDSWYSYTACVHDDAPEVHYEEDLWKSQEILRERWLKEHSDIL